MKKRNNMSKITTKERLKNLENILILLQHIDDDYHYDFDETDVMVEPYNDEVSIESITNNIKSQRTCVLLNLTHEDLK